MRKGAAYTITTVLAFISFAIALACVFAASFYVFYSYWYLLLAPLGVAQCVLYFKYVDTLAYKMRGVTPPCP